MDEIKNFIFSRSSPNGCVAFTRSERDELIELIENAAKEQEERHRKRIKDYNLCGNTVDKQTYNEVVNENYFLRQEIEKLNKRNIAVQKICFDSCL